MHKLKTVLGGHAQLKGVRAQPRLACGVEMDFIEIKRMPDAYRDMARTQPYDICEMAPTMYLMALQRGAAITALPLPMTRRFRHGGLLKRKGITIDSPKALEGRKVGVRNYSVTAAVWTRGIYADDYGLDSSQVTWITEEPENLVDLVLPPNVQRLPPGRKLVQAIDDGELDVAFDGLAGAADAKVDLEPLMPSVDAVERQWYERTGIYPIHGIVVVRNEVLQSHPRLALELTERFVASKQAYLDSLDAIADPSGDDKRYRKLRNFIADPLPFGLEPNRKSLDALVRYAHQQKLINKEVKVDDIVISPEATAQGRVATWR